MSSCRSLTYKVPDGKYLLTVNRFKVNGKRQLSNDLSAYVIQKPNRKRLGFIPLDLMMYNQFDAKLDQPLKAWYDLPKPSQKELDTILLKYNLKQYVGSSLRFNRFFYNNGQPPVILDTIESQKSVENLRKYFHSQGYFNAEVHKHLKFKGKKATQTFVIQPKKGYTIDTISTHIFTPALAALYDQTKEKSFLKSGQPFKTDDFERERNRLVTLFQNQGYYKFNEDGQSIHFDVDSTLVSHKTQVRLFIDGIKPSADSNQKFENKEIHKMTIQKPYTVEQVKVFLKAQKSTEEDLKDSLQYKGYNLFVSKGLNYKPSVLTYGIQIKPNSLYKRNNIEQSLLILEELNNFKLNELRFVEKPNQKLDAEIRLSTLNKYDLGFFLESTYSNALSFGISPGINFRIRNLFGGGENLDMELKSTLGTVKNISKSEIKSENNHFFNASQISFNSKLSFPSILSFPFISNWFPASYSPKTILNIGGLFQKNIGLDRVIFNSGFQYTFQPSKKTSHFIDIFGLQFTRNLRTDKYYSIYPRDAEILLNTVDHYKKTHPDFNVENNPDLQATTILNDKNYEQENFEQYRGLYNLIWRKQRITQNQLIGSFGYTFNYSQTQDPFIKNPWRLRLHLETAGNLYALADKLIKQEQIEYEIGKPQKTILRVPYAQYFKFDLDVRKTLNLNKYNSWVFRLFLGAIFPYGNSNIAPFDRSYFAGGASDIRAWRAYDLGPGQTKVNSRDYAIDDLKLTINTEYRYRIYDKLYGALFLDAGNIWSTNKKKEDPDAQFYLNRFLKQLALGGGTGFRYDFNYFIFRLDLAYKIYNPQRIGMQPWVINKSQLKDIVINFGINYPF